MEMKDVQVSECFVCFEPTEERIQNCKCNMHVHKKCVAKMRKRMHINECPICKIPYDTYKRDMFQKVLISCVILFFIISLSESTCGDTIEIKNPSLLRQIFRQKELKVEHQCNYVDFVRVFCIIYYLLVFILYTMHS